MKRQTLYNIAIITILIFLGTLLIGEAITMKEVTWEKNCYDRWGNAIIGMRCIQKSDCGIVSIALKLECSKYLRYKR